jgi:cGMP-dependent protein kinase
MMYSDPIPAKIVSENMYVVSESGKNCRGFVILGNLSEVQVRNAKVNNRYPFAVKDEDVEIIFYAENDIIRQEWISTIQQAIEGIRHNLDNPVLIYPNYSSNAQLKASMFSTTGPGRVAATDFPHKSGYLKKISSGTSAFGLNKTVKRWFRLEGGELRYYEDEDIRPSKLKSTLDLRGAQLSADSKDNSPVFRLELTNGRSMRLEAPSAAEAVAWRDAIGETLALLENLKDSKGEYRALRRFNLHERLSPEEKQQLIAIMRGGTSSPGPSPVRRTASLFGSSSQKRSPAPNMSPPPPSPQTSPMAGGGLSKMLQRHSQSFIGSSDGVNLTGSFKSPQTVELLTRVLFQHFLLKEFHGSSAPASSTSSNANASAAGSSDFQAILDKLHEKVVMPGEVILWQGSSGDLFYILERGVCEVVKDHRRVALLQPGTSFGEMALLNSALRQATIRATSLCRLWCLSRKDFREVANKHEQQKLVERMDFLRQIELFNGFMDSNLEKIAEVMVLKSYHTGDKIIRQGDHGDCFYMIASGRVLVTQQQGGFATAASIELVRLGPHKHFGELALIDDTPRKATVAATTPVTCWTIDRKNFQHLFGNMSSAVNENMTLSVLKRVKLLESLSERHLMEIAKHFVMKDYGEGDMIIQQGDPGDGFYVLAAGKVSVQVNHVQVAALEGGAFFGEMALMSNDRRTASVIASQPETKCLILSREKFIELLGPLDALLQVEAQRRSEMQKMVERRRSSLVGGSGSSGSLFGRIFSGSTTSSTASAASSGSAASGTSPSSASGILPTSNSGLYATTNALFKLQHLERIRKLGMGTFGTVYLVQHTPSSKFYAMKCLNKEHLFTTNQERYAYTERDIMLLLSDSCFVPPLYATLQDDKSLFLVEQYIAGGDLFSVLHQGSSNGSISALARTKLGGISSGQALFYASNVLAAMQHMHDRDVIYRDWKPENMMIDVTGYIKLVDYGSAKILTLGEKTETLCGTAEYISPEMILSKSYNRSVDYWSLGIFIFELLTRKTPFAHPNLVILYQNVLQVEETLPLQFQSLVGLDNNAKNIIQALLSVNANTRLGLLYNGIKDIWNDPFYRGVTLEQIERRIVPAPFIPSNDDTVPVLKKSEEERDTLDFIDLLEDPDDIPPYTGCCDFSSF